jgi:U3 small nucleolar RNA-associated protein MPP10
VALTILRYQDLTTYEKRMASLQDQIAELESENVAPKEWMFTGETDSRQRPQNSLLEEDLEFDRVRKAVPVITEEVVQSLEERIKARVLEGRFDDVVRIRPLEDKPFLPSKLLELQDTKSTQSLAQIYESEYLANQTGGSLPDDRDGRLKKEHDEITILWEKMCSKLDALSNAHFVPKQVNILATCVLFHLNIFISLAKGQHFDGYKCAYCSDGVSSANLQIGK